jgi:hypothetical protein
VLLDGWLRQSVCELLDIGSYVQRLDIDDLVESLERTPGGKFADGAQVRPAGVFVADIGGEVLDEPYGRRVRIGGVQRQ